MNIAEFVLIIIGQLLAAGAAWGAIRSDVRHIIRELDRVDRSVADAHRRIDHMLAKRID